MGNTSNRLDYTGTELEAMVAARNYCAWILQEIRPFLGRDIVEVGAGIGTFSKMILEEIQPDRFVALEPAKNLQPILKTNLEPYSQAEVIEAFLSEIKDGFPLEPDTMLYINVLEHVADDTEELKHAYDLLKSGGHICIFVPALKSLYSEFDHCLGHFRRYARDELHELMQLTRLKIVKTLYFDIFGAVTWWFLFCLMKRRSLHQTRIAIYDTLVVPLAKAIEKQIVPPIGKNILVVGRK